MRTIVSFMGRQCLDMLAPSNQPWSNPEVLPALPRRSRVELWRGALHAMQDGWRHANHQPPPGAGNFMVGRDVAVTPGKVVMRNELAELIQYSPSTPTRVRRAGAAGAGVDHEVLHPGPVTAQLAGALAGGAGAHGVLPVVRNVQAQDPRLVAGTTTGAWA